MKNDKGIAFKIGYFIGTIACRFIGAGFLMWGWNTIAPALERPDILVLGNVRDLYGTECFRGCFPESEEFLEGR